MGLTAGIVGLPNVGKSTLFNAITKSNVLSANYPFATIEPNVGIVEVHDERLDKIVELVNPRNVVYATVSFTDIAGLVKGASKGEGLGNQFLSHIREVDAICHVVRCFDNKDIIHVNDKVDPVSDMDVINTELAIADIEVIDRRIAKVEKKAQLKADAESVKEYALLCKLKNAIEKGESLRNLEYTPEEEQLLKTMNLLSYKPMLYILNVSEDDIINGTNKYIPDAIKYVESQKSSYVIISAKMEEDLCQLEDDEKELLLEDYGLDSSGLDKLIKKAYEILGLLTFFTQGEKECRAWTFKKGMKAPQCAGVIHSDFEKGFIKAKVMSYDDFMLYKSEAKVKEAGKMRLEGKDYVFQDGDITEFMFNVSK